MKYLFFCFLLCAGALAVLVNVQQESNPFADGRLACLPLPPALERQKVVAMLTPGPVNLAHLQNPAAPIQVAAPKFEIYEPEPDNRALAEVRQTDRSDWGMSRFQQGDPMMIASLMQPRIVNPVPVSTPAPPQETEIPAIVNVPAAPVETPAAIVPNLYLPEGALNEAGANLTLIRNELHAYKEPDAKAEAAPFVLKEGQEVRPLTRMRNEKDFDWIKFERDGKSWWAQAEYFIRVDPRNRVAAGVRNIPVGQEIVDRNSALPSEYFPSDMVAVPPSLILDNREIKLRKEAAQALGKMADAASKKGLKLRIFSGYRDFDHQKRLYLESVEKKGPKQNGTAAPGYSEHQLGTTVDICNSDKRYLLSGKFADTPEGRWLYENSEKYGFRNSYTWENSDESGYKAEPWHLRYVGTYQTDLKRGVAQK